MLIKLVPQKLGVFRGFDKSWIESFLGIVTNISRCSASFSRLILFLFAADSMIIFRSNIRHGFWRRNECKITFRKIFLRGFIWYLSVYFIDLVLSRPSNSHRPGW